MMATYSSYFYKLNTEFPDVAERYIHKLKKLDGLDPYIIPDSSFSSAPRDFPIISTIDIVSYLVLTTSAYTKDQMKAYKSLAAFKYFEAGFILKCGCLKKNDIYIIRANVKHSQRMNEPCLIVWILINEDGSVETGHCTCIAGTGEVCSHVGAVLFALEFLSREDREKSCTDVAAMWKVPSVTKVSCEPLKAMNFGKSIEGVAVGGITPPSEQSLIDFLKKIEEFGSSVVTRGLEPWATEIANDLECQQRETITNPLKDLFNEEFTEFDNDQLAAVVKELTFDVSEEICARIEQITRDQNTSNEWYIHRTGRITASIFKTVCKTSLQKPSLSLIKTICYQRKFKTPATEWGKKHEKTAIECYIDYNNSTHDNFHCKRTGLIINSKFPCFAATPDGMVTCICCGEGCLEVKCPFLMKSMSLEQFATHKASCLTINEAGDGICLDQEHAYFFQVQMQMALTNTTFCDFVVWSPTSPLYVERIPFNEDFWLHYHQKAEAFHKTVILPELLAKIYTSNYSSSPETWCICKGEDDGRPMIACDNDNCKIVWYHFECLNMTEVPNCTFICEDCGGN